MEWMHGWMDRSQPELGRLSVSQRPPRTTTPSFGRVSLFEGDAQGVVIQRWQLTKSRHVKGGSLAPFYAAAAAVWGIFAGDLGVSDSSFLDVS